MFHEDDCSIDFLVIGGQKCGTTSLHDWLAKEELVSLPTYKETHFFSHDDRFSLGFEWYKSQFQENDNDSHIKGEVDPEYLFFAQSAERIAQLKTAPKIIVLLRNPLERALSHYKMSVRRGIEKRPFIQALNSDVESISIDSFHESHFSYFKRGLYGKQLSRFIAKCPKSEIAYVMFEDLFGENTQESEYLRICQFIGIQSTLRLDALNLQSNAAVSPRFYWLNSLIWDKRRFSTLRDLSKIILSRRIRRVLYQLVYSSNIKARNKDQGSGLLAEPPDKVMQLLKEDACLLNKLTGLDFTHWFSAYD